MAKVLFDASVYIKAWRERRFHVYRSGTSGDALVYLSAVVGAELLHGASNKAIERNTLQLWHRASGARRLVVPHSHDWQDTGVVLAQLGAKYGREDVARGRLVHDVLIALSARRLGITVVTHNLADFERIREFRGFSLLAADE